MPSDDSAPHPLGYYRGVLRTPREPLGCRVRSLSTEILRYQGKISRIYLRADAEQDAAFAVCLQKSCATRARSRPDASENSQRTPLRYNPFAPVLNKKVP